MSDPGPGVDCKFYGGPLVGRVLAMPYPPPPVWRAAIEPPRLTIGPPASALECLELPRYALYELVRHTVAPCDPTFAPSPAYRLREARP